MTSQKIIFLTTVGLLSGVLSSIFFFIKNSFLNLFIALFILPGVLFGIALSLFIILTKKQRNPYKIGGFIIISSIAYAVPALYILFIAGHGFQTNILSAYNLISFFLSGSVGAFILLCGFRFLLTPLKNSQWLVLTLLGGLLGAVGWLAPLPMSTFRAWNMVVSMIASSPQDGDINMITLQIIWQTGMALAIGVCMKLNEKEVKL